MYFSKIIVIVELSKNNKNELNSWYSIIVRYYIEPCAFYDYIFAYQITSKTKPKKKELVWK